MGTLTWTGHLGVESGMPGFKGNVCRLFGDWALQETFHQDCEGAHANQEEQESEFNLALPAELRKFFFHFQAATAKGIQLGFFAVFCTLRVHCTSCTSSQKVSIVRCPGGKSLCLG